MAGEERDPQPQRGRSTAWGDVCPFPVAGRQAKPRELGLTMVIDKGMGVAQTADLLDVCGEHVDLLKLAFGTSAFYPEDVLRRKIAAAAAHHVAVYPGGTFLEVAGRDTSSPSRAGARGVGPAASPSPPEDRTAGRPPDKGAAVPACHERPAGPKPLSPSR